MSPTIRRATPDDAQALSWIGAETFTETFGHLYPPEDLEAFLDTAYGLEKTRANLADPAKAAWLVETAEGHVIGYAEAGPSDLPHPEVQPADGELKRLYLLKAHQNGGVGRRLLDTVLAWLEQRGPRRLWIGVWSQNFGAQRLYGRLGFEKVGEYQFPVGRVLDDEYILRRG
ncbi:GNAT family N-acetyltransferase [Caulobacter sp. SLTY]|uniref:GNAT family N-acetyltransferase n=1 Tax=Caulobacter sp. SLTY TaxID=2683262 RepID=UPI001412F5F8|nr:GNAT family N-acetyltransferase [Caulobacter sp. SLTY]NBB17204.1 GNAT family N-acetyltransferase [Caulobacter sp. SLTY]